MRYSYIHCYSEIGTHEKPSNPVFYCCYMFLVASLMSICFTGNHRQYALFDYIVKLYFVILYSCVLLDNKLTTTTTIVYSVYILTASNSVVSWITLIEMLSLLVFKLNTRVHGLLKQDMFVNKYILVWLLICWWQCWQPIRNQVWKFIITSMDFNMDISE